MQWNRRQILFGLGGLLALAGVGFGSKRLLAGCMQFEDWRAIPGLKMGLALDIERPDLLEIRIMARCDGAERCLSVHRGASRMQIEIPRIETRQESYILYAEARDWLGRRCLSDEVEVIAQPYQFGL